MAEKTGIEWADATWNPWMGCKKVSPGCKNCYMFRDMTFYGRDPNTVVRAADSTFRNPLRWAKSEKLKDGARVFTCSWSDWFIDKADDWREEAWAIIKATPQFTYLILTKRPERIKGNLPADWGTGYPNVWLGTSAENQEMANLRIPELLTIPAAIHWISAEPLLGEIDLEEVGEILECNLIDGRLDWVVTGGESDKKNPRPSNAEWFEKLLYYCAVQEVAFFHKQNGGTKKINGAWGGRELDGKTYDEFPSPCTDMNDQQQ